jgi:putative transposase
VPLSHPFVERLIGTLRREYLDRILFWTTVDLDAKLTEFQHYYNGHRTHAGLEGGLPEPTGRHRPSICNPTDGEDIVEACIRLQSQHEL